MRRASVVPSSHCSAPSPVLALGASQPLAEGPPCAAQPAARRRPGLAHRPGARRAGERRSPTQGITGAARWSLRSLHDAGLACRRATLGPASRARGDELGDRRALDALAGRMSEIVARHPRRLGEVVARRAPARRRARPLGAHRAQAASLDRPRPACTSSVRRCSATQGAAQADALAERVRGVAAASGEAVHAVVRSMQEIQAWSNRRAPRSSIEASPSRPTCWPSTPRSKRRATTAGARAQRFAVVARRGRSRSAAPRRRESRSSSARRCPASPRGRATERASQTFGEITPASAMADQLRAIAAGSSQQSDGYRPDLAGGARTRRHHPAQRRWSSWHGIARPSWANAPGA